jgi:hypothetical protein
MEELNMPGDFNFKNLNPDVRQYILREIDWDIAEGVLYPSKNFTDAGRIEYPALLRSAATDYNEVWLAARLIGLFNEMEMSAGKPKRVRRDAHTFFAQSEFNRFYCRGLCSYALANPSNGIRIYRARESSKPRRESEAKRGRMVDAATILKDLRAHVGTDVEFGTPEIYSGLSLELVPNANAI